MSAEGKPRASRAGYWIGGAIALVGVIAGVIVLVSNFKGVARELSSFQRVTVPSAKTLSLPAGRHVVYFESGQGQPSPGQISVRVQDAETGGILALKPYATSFTYDAGGRSGRAGQTFDTQRAGRYRVTTMGPPNADLSVAVGPPLGGTLVSRIFGAFGGIGLLLGGPLVGGVLALVTALRRRRPGGSAGTAAAAGSATTGAPTAPASAPAGWYPDPSGQARTRWWDGSRWTDHTG